MLWRRTLFQTRLVAQHFFLDFIWYSYFMKLFTKERRQQRQKFYQKPIWRKIRANQLRKAGLCEKCLAMPQKRIRLATICDHINGWTDYKSFVSGPFQSLCFECDNFKRFAEDIPNMLKKEKTKLEVKDI